MNDDFYIDQFDAPKTIISKIDTALRDHGLGIAWEWTETDSGFRVRIVEIEEKECPQTSLP